MRKLLRQCKMIWHVIPGMSLEISLLLIHTPTGLNVRRVDCLLRDRGMRATRKVIREKAIRTMVLLMEYRHTDYSRTMTKEDIDLYPHYQRS